jgi:hypothetical protein
MNYHRTKKIGVRNYFHDWNDLLRVAQILFSTSFPFNSEELDEIRIHEIQFWVSITIYSKELAFNDLVEAAKWIKQQEK